MIISKSTKSSENSTKSQDDWTGILKHGENGCRVGQLISKGN